MPTGLTYSERELLSRIAEGDEKAFLLFFNERADGVFAIVNRIVRNTETSRDIVQETFLAAWKHREQLASMEKPSMWLLKTATNFSLKHLRRRKLEEAWIRHVETRAEETGVVSPDANARELDKWIGQAVHALPPQRKKIYQLSREAGLNRREIAEMLGISEHTVKNQLAEALKNIQAFLIERGIQLSVILAYSIFFCLE